MPDTTPPVTREIEARFREILAEEFDRLGLRSSAAEVRDRPLHPARDYTIKAAVEAMSRAYSLDRASGDGVRAQTIEKCAKIADTNDNYGSCGGIKQEIARKIRALSAVPQESIGEYKYQNESITSVSSALPPAGGWRDIATAPKDGSEMLVGYFGKPSGKFYYDIAAWVQGGFYTRNGLRCYADLWQPMPLPAPPASDKE